MTHLRLARAPVYGPTLAILLTLASCGSGSPSIGGAGEMPMPDDGDDPSGVHGSVFVREALVHSIASDGFDLGIPIIMVPGANLSSYIYVATPDGREGWAQRFAAAGHDVHVINDPNFEWSRGFGIAPFQVPTDGAPPPDPLAVRAWNRDVWRRWGLGSAEGSPYPDTRFPTDHFEVFEANYPYVSSAGRSYSDALIALLDEVGPAILLAHSAGGPRAVTAALARPHLVGGFVLIEPTGPPDDDDFPGLAGMSMLGVYGDYIDSRNQTNRKLACQAAAVLFAQNGGSGELISLPEDHGVHGNTHLMMQDDNSEFIADLILSWLDTHLGAGP